MDVSSSVATRRVGRALALLAGAAVRVIYGPFLVGEVVAALELYLEEINAVIGDSVQIDIAVFGAEPSAAAFASGRPLTVGGPLLPLLARHWRIPVGFVASESEMYLVVQLTELNADTPDGSIWLEVSSW